VLVLLRKKQFGAKKTVDPKVNFGNDECGSKRFMEQQAW
jgi:hypothetical protein